MNDADQVRTLRELLGDCLEVVRGASAATANEAAKALYDRARSDITALLRDVDDLATHLAPGP